MTGSRGASDPMFGAVGRENDAPNGSVPQGCLRIKVRVNALCSILNLIAKETLPLTEYPVREWPLSTKRLAIFRQNISINQDTFE